MITLKKIVSETDSDTIKQIYGKAFNHDEKEMDFYYPGFSKYIKYFEKQGFSYIAYIDGEPCGVLLAYLAPEIVFAQELYIDTVAVVPEHQRKGVCTEMLNMVKQQAVDNNIFQMSLRTPCYRDSYEVYKKYGFKDSKNDMRYMVLGINSTDSLSTLCDLLRERKNILFKLDNEEKK